MKKIRIFFAYKHTDKPWGGANNFIRALYNNLSKNPRFIVRHDAKLPYDILFFNQLSRGPGNVAEGDKRRYSFSDIKKMRIETGAKLVVRAVNLNLNSDRPNLFNSLSYLKNGLIPDINVIRLVNIADCVIFQSRFQKSFFRRWGYQGKNDIVILNGAPPIFKNDNYTLGNCHNPIRLVSNSNFKTFKKHDIVARMSLIPGVKITHVGNWSNKFKIHKVDLKGTLPHEEIVKIYKDSDFLFHPAVNDPCPNSVIEALNFGLPVIYNPRKGSSAELVRNNGFPLIENNLSKTIRIARKKFLFFKRNLANEREYYSINRAVAAYLNVFNKYS